MDFCDNCGHSVEFGELICPQCGSNLNGPEGNFTRCSHGHIIPDGAQFCPWCGEAVKPGSNRATLMVDSEEPRKTVRLPDLDTKRTVIIRPGQENEADAGQPILTGFLVSYSLSRQGQFFPLREGRQTIGKGQSMRIKINDALLSEEHALILCRGGKFIFEDRLSSNGSVVNGQEVNGQVVLQHGDFLTLGAHSYTLVVVPKSELSKS